jgi:hypothetical protein
MQRHDISWHYGFDRLRLRPWRHAKQQHISQAPDLIGESCRHRWRARAPHRGGATAVGGNGLRQRLAQAGMGQDEIMISLEPHQLLVQPVFTLTRCGTAPLIAAPRCRRLRFSRLQSVDRSLRPPLLQIGACPFPCTPLRSILMLVTHPWRERVPMLPRFRLVAMSMERLPVRRARLSVVAIDVVPLDPVVLVEEPSTGATAAAWRWEQPGQSCTDTEVSALSPAPVHPVPIRGTAVAVHLHLPGKGHLAVRPQTPGIGVFGRGGKGALTT